MPFLAICKRCNHHLFANTREAMVTFLRQHFRDAHHGKIPPLPNTKKEYIYLGKGGYKKKQRSEYPESSDYILCVLRRREYEEIMQMLANPITKRAFFASINTKL